jgi:hypothetical protein
MVVSMAQYVTGAKLPDIQDLYTRGCQRKSQFYLKEPPKPQTVYSVTRTAETNRTLNSFYHQAIRLIKSESFDYPDYLH